MPQARTQPTQIVAIANQKGGVGKTTTAVNLATVLASSQPVLLVDLDPQGNASTGLGIGRADRRAGTYALLSGRQPFEAVVRQFDVLDLHVLPAEADLAAAEVELAEAADREFRLRVALADVVKSDRFATIIVDCPPSLGLLTINALAAATDVMVPLQCEFYALEGVSQIARTIDVVSRRLNPKLRLEGIVLTMYDRRNNLSEAVAADARAHFKDRVYRTMIPRNVKVSEAPSHGLPVTLYDHRSPGASAYVSLGLEFLQRRRARADTPR